MESFSSDWTYYLFAVLLFLGNLGGWLATLLGLPGNWLILLGTSAFAWWFADAEGRGVGWLACGILLLLAVVGEVVEFLASAAAAAQQGASRRAVAGSIGGAVLGGIAGGLMGLPIPIVGPLVAAVLGSALGALAGGFFGEWSQGRDSRQSWQVGRAALIGRLLGTAGKLIAGTVMLVVATWASFS